MSAHNAVSKIGWVDQLATVIAHVCMHPASHSGPSDQLATQLKNEVNINFDLTSAASGCVPVYFSPLTLVLVVICLWSFESINGCDYVRWRCHGTAVLLGQEI